MLTSCRDPPEPILYISMPVFCQRLGPNRKLARFKSLAHRLRALTLMHGHKGREALAHRGRHAR